VVDGPPAPTVPEGTPGGGPVPPWLASVRALVTTELDRCLASGPATIKTGTALVHVRIDGDGHVLESTLVRSSGSEAYDACLLQALRTVRAKPPPPEALEADGQADMELAFR
jgi:TonB family protein